MNIKEDILYRISFQFPFVGFIFNWILNCLWNLYSWAYEAFIKGGIKAINTSHVGLWFFFFNLIAAHCLWKMMIIRRWIDINIKSDILFRALSEAFFKDIARELWASIVVHCRARNKFKHCTMWISHGTNALNRLMSRWEFSFWVSKTWKLSSLHRNAFILCLWLYLFERL